MVLYTVFKKGTPHKDPGMDLITYLNNRPPASTINYVTVTGNDRKKLKFDKPQKEMIQQCTGGEEFDITLLVHCIKIACEGVAELNDPSWCTVGLELENCIYMIKKQRNEAMHEPLRITKTEFQKRERDLRQLLINTANALQLRYSHSMTTKERDDIIKDIKDTLDCIRDGNMLQEMRHECQEELKMRLTSMKHFNPVSFILGSNLALDVTLVFTDIEIVHGAHRGACVVSYQDFLVEIQKSKYKVVLLEGVAGAGKTTLINLMLQEWCAGYGNIKELDAYEVILHVMCRDPTTVSYSSLVEKSLPSTFTQFDKSTLPLLAQCRILVLIDGLDEATKASRELVNDVLCQLNGVDATIICTSRPERSLDFQNMGFSSTPVMYTSILGIPENKRVEFIERNHIVLEQKTGSGRDTRKLVQQMKEKVMLEHFRIPLNLILAVWVWDQDPDAFGDITTQTELYYHTHRLHKMKLQERLLKCQNTSGLNQETTMNLIKEWETVLFRELLVALSFDQLVLTDEALERLRKEASTRGLPAGEMLGAYLTSKCTKSGFQKYSAPHKGLQDYYAALHIVETIKEFPHSSRNKIMTVLKNAVGKNSVEVKKYQSVLQHLAGILHLHMNPVPGDLVAEVVELLGNTGIRSTEQWLDLVEDTKASSAVLAAIARTALTFRDERGNMRYPRIIVKDGRVNGYSALLPHLSPTRLKISIDCISLNLEPLVGSLASHTYAVELSDSWGHPNHDFSPHPSIMNLVSRWVFRLLLLILFSLQDMFVFCHKIWSPL